MRLCNPKIKRFIYASWTELPKHCVFGPFSRRKTTIWCWNYSCKVDTWQMWFCLCWRQARLRCDYFSGARGCSGEGWARPGHSGVGCVSHALGTWGPAGVAASLEWISFFTSAPASCLANVNHLYAPLPLRPSVTLPPKPQRLNTVAFRFLGALPLRVASHLTPCTGAPSHLRWLRPCAKGMPVGVASLLLLATPLLMPDLVSLTSLFKVLRVNYGVYYLHLHSW